MAECVAVFIDHKEARIFHIQPEKVDEVTNEELVVAGHVRRVVGL